MIKDRKYIKKIRNIILLLTIILFIVMISFGKTYSNFIYKSNYHRAVEMHINKLEYRMNIDDVDTSKISVSSGNSVINIKLKSNNEIDTYYKIVYLSNPSISIYYINDIPYGKIESNGEKNIKLFISNASNINVDIELMVCGGYITNELDDIIIPNGYIEIERQIKVGDYVSYIPNGVYDITKYTIDKINSGYNDNQDIYLQKSNYRIFNINNDGTIDIISENEIYIDSENNKLYLDTTLDNKAYILDDIVNKLYGSSKYSINSKNININDIVNKLRNTKYNEIYNYEYSTLNDNFSINENDFIDNVYYELLINNKSYCLTNSLDDTLNKIYFINNGIVKSDLSDLLNDSFNIVNAIRPIITLSSNNNIDYVDGLWLLK